MADPLYKTGIRPIIDQYLLDEAAKVRDYGLYWSASSAGYCMRKLIFARLGVPEINPDARKQRVFSAGHIFHSWIQELTRDAGISIAQEVELEDEQLMIRGHFDDLVLIDGTLLLIDYKTVNSKSFTWARKQLKTTGIEQPMGHFHRMQLGTYMYMLRNNRFESLEKILPKGPMFKPLEEARILRIEKENLMMDEKQLMWSPELEADVLAFWNELNQWWNAKKIPRCTCAVHENGFMAQEKYNPYFYGGNPCSISWYELCKKERKLKENK